MSTRPLYPTLPYDALPEPAALGLQSWEDTHAALGADDFHARLVAVDPQHLGLGCT